MSGAARRSGDAVSDAVVVRVQYFTFVWTANDKVTKAASRLRFAADAKFSERDLSEVPESVFTKDAQVD